LHMKRSQ
jgi:quercetin dioxygenase-like cupin family protein